MSETKPLTLDEFPIPSYEDWKAAAIETLKGAPFEKKLLTKTIEGITIQPLYRKEDLAKLNHLGSLPGEAPYVRGTKTEGGWKIVEDAPGAPGVDPLGKAVCGCLDKPLEAAFDELAKADAVAVNTRLYHNAGGNAVQELAFAIATGVEYLREAEKRGVAIDAIAPKITFGFAMGADIFMAIAKLRAARLLWSKVVAACGGNAKSQKARIHASTSLWNKSKLDPYVNMLRGTTEAFSAVAGGADSIYVGPFDEVVREPDDFSKRIARNTQVILSEECHFDHVVDPAGGSYYVETLTAQVAEAAYAIFQQIEKDGGMTAALKAGSPQKQVKTVAADKAKQVAQRRLQIVGVNVTPNPTEKPLEGAPRKCCCGGKGIDTGIEPLKPIRGAEPFEALRDAVSASAKKNIFLATMGPLRQHKPRADFSTSFFQAGGYNVLESKPYKTVEEAADAAKASDAGIVIICSTDDTYPEIVPALAPKLKAEGKIVILAGAPADDAQQAAFTAAGVDEFISIRSNCLQVLSGLATKLGIL